MTKVLTLFCIRKKKINVFLFFISLALMHSVVSCAVEEVQVSHNSKSFANISSAGGSVRKKETQSGNVDLLQYTSELTNICSSIPICGDAQINKNLNQLKFSISEYIHGIREANQKGKNKAFLDYEKMYKKIQKDKTKLTLEDQKIMDRYLVRIKTNMSRLESLTRSN